VIIKNTKNDENIILKFDEKYYDLSKFPYEVINIPVTSNITFLGRFDGTVFDFKKNDNGMMKFSNLKDNGNIVKFENIIFKNFGQELNSDINIFSFNSDTDRNYLKIKNCTFINNQYTLFDINISYFEEYSNVAFNSEYFIIFDNCDF